MQQLSGLDTVFLNLETNAVPMHIGSLAIIDPSEAGPDFGFESVRRLIERRLHLLPMFRRRLMTTPMGLDQPYWIEDPDFDIEMHVRHRALPRPGTMKQLNDLVCDVMSIRLDRSMPLWKLYYVEGLEGGKVALVSKIHHACIDGVSGAELFSTLLDTTPKPREVPPPDVPWIPDELPPPWKLSYITAKNFLARPAKVYKLARRTIPLVLDIRREAMARQQAARRSQPVDVEPPQKSGAAAPRMRFNATITARRSYAAASLSLTDIKMVKNVFGVSLNDVVLCLCAEALRSYLGARKELPAQPLVAAVPMSVRGEGESGGNRVTMLRTSLATDIADPVERLQALSAKMVGVKRSMKAIPASLMLDWVHTPPPSVMAQAARLYENFAIQNLVHPPFNLVISNVPGPKSPLYLNGAKVEAHYPISIPYHGLACNITVFSYQDSLDVGITAHRGTVPEVQEIMDGMTSALAQLLERAQQQLRRAG
ncbi:MAG TPA: wax ester/triacylglycerol synthase family O-acyltransferase [Solimonas sp.]|nr:wax ester/triacylglycerol synthase family O-acyltransferase [Solimonas sp.]